MNRFLETSSGRIAISESGQGRASILFIHGNSANQSVFSRQLESRIAERCRLIAFDLPGHGKSDNAKNPHGDYTIGSYAHLVSELADTLHLEPLVLVGWSLGGHVAIEAAAQGLTVAGIVLSGTPPVGPGVEHIGKAFKASEKMALTGKPNFDEQDVADYARAAMGGAGNVTKDLLQAVARTDGIARQIMLENWSSPDTGHDQRRFVEEWKNPIAVLQGEQDALISGEYLQALDWKNLWRNQIQWFEGAGHAPFWQNAVQFNKLLEQFLKDIGH